VKLNGFEDHYPWQLSGGMQQRVAIARALACRPDVLLMDEPFSAVDAPTRVDLQEIVLRLWRELGLTIVLVTHDGHHLLAQLFANEGLAVGGRKAL